ncbi:hypothetical protein HNR52_002398 [Thermoanaerobacterium thermosulfurigenes]
MSELIDTKIEKFKLRFAEKRCGISLKLYQRVG